MKKHTLSALLLLLPLSSHAATYKASLGIHDLIVHDIKDDGALGDIKPGTAHTFGINSAFLVEHKTKNDINLLAKIELLLDRNKHHLDPDHIPLWIKYLIEGDGQISRINENSQFKWSVFMDGKQNTASSIERVVRQFVGAGWHYQKNKFEFGANAYLGFYFIEIDDDTPVNRGYKRDELDDGESANLFELTSKYQYSDNVSMTLRGRYFSSNTGITPLEQNLDFSLTYDKFLDKNMALNFKIEHVKYDFDRFNTREFDILPWDSDTLVQLSVTKPF